MTAAAVLWITALFCQAAVGAQAPPPPTALIVGRVVDGGSGRPVAGAMVSLTGGGEKKVQDVRVGGPR